MQADAVVKSPVARRVGVPESTWFAPLAAIGAFWLVQSVLVGIALLLLVVGVFHRESGPPRFEPTLLPAAFAGAFVGVRLGHWRGFLGLLAFASIPFIRALSYPIGAAVDCSHGNVDACRGATDFDFVLAQAWLLPGLALGVLAAVMTRLRVPLRVELEALAPIAIIQYVGGHVLPPLMRGYPAPSAFDIVMTAIGLVAAAYIVARRSAKPIRSALIIAGVLLLSVAALIIFELWMNADPPWEATLWHQWLSFAGPLALVIAAYALLGTRRVRGRTPFVSAG